MSVHRCKVCGRALRDPESVAKGMGPSCERKVIGIARGMTASRKARRPSGEPECVGLFGKEENDG